MHDRRSEPSRQDRVGRWALLRELDRLTDRPLIVLSFVWLVLLVIDLVRGLSPPLELLTYGIWAVFIGDVVIELLIAPDRRHYLRTHWLRVVSLALPVLRVLRVVRLARAAWLARSARPLSLLRIVTSVNRGIGALGRTLARRGLGYVIVLTALVAVVGAAGMVAFEAQTSPGSPSAVRFGDYGDALWWTLMLLTTIGAEGTPSTIEGRVLAFLLGSYGLGVFGYITAALASHFLADPDRERDREVRALSREVRSMRSELERLRPGPAGMLAATPDAPPDRRSSR